MNVKLLNLCQSIRGIPHFIGNDRKKWWKKPEQTLPLSLSLIEQISACINIFGWINHRPLGIVHFYALEILPLKMKAMQCICCHTSLRNQHGAWTVLNRPPPISRTTCQKLGASKPTEEGGNLSSNSLQKSNHIGIFAPRPTGRVSLAHNLFCNAKTTRWSSDNGHLSVP